MYYTVSKINLQFSISQQYYTQFSSWQKLTFTTVTPHSAAAEAVEEFLDHCQSLHVDGVWAEGPYHKPNAESETKDHIKSHSKQHLFH